MGKPNTNYLVISYDHDEQRTFYDIAVNNSRDLAMREIDDRRGEYATVYDALSLEELLDFARAMRSRRYS